LSDPSDTRKEQVTLVMEGLQFSEIEKFHSSLKA